MRTSASDAKVGANWLLAAASLVIVLAGLRAAQPVLVPVAFAAFIGLLVAPVVAFLHARGVPRVVGGSAMVAAVLLVFAGLGGMLVGSVQRFVAVAPRYQAQLDDRFTDVAAWLDRVGLPISRQMLLELLSPGAAIGLAGRMLGELAGVLSSAFLVVLTLVFVLIEATVLPAKLRALAGDSVDQLGRFARIAIDVKSYVLVKTYTSAATGLVIGLGLWVIGLDFPFLWAVIAFVLNFVPTLGSILASVPPTLLALVQFDFGSALVVLALYLVVNVSIGSLLEPRVMGARLGLSTLVVFLSLLFWGWLWGPAGRSCRCH